MNIIEIRVQAVNDTEAGFAEAEASARDAGAAAGAAFAEALLTTLDEQVPGAGDGLGQLLGASIAEGASSDIGTTAASIGAALEAELPDSLAQAGTAAGDGLGAAIEQGAAGSADSIGQQLATDLTEQVSGAGTQAGEAGAEQLAGSLEGGVSNVGDVLAARISDQLRRGLDEQAQSTMAALGSAMRSGAAGISVGVGASLAQVLTLAAVGAAGQAGDAGGVALIAGIGVGAAGGSGAAAERVGAALQSQLSDTLTGSGASAGAGLLAGVAQGAADGADDAAQRIADSLQPPLESSMTQVGMAAGDAFNAGLASAAQAGSAGSGGGESVAADLIDFEKTEEDIREQGARIEAAEQAEFERIRQAQIIRAQSAFADNPLGIEPYEGHPSMSRSLEQEQQQASAQQALELVPSREEFLALSDEGVGAYIEETQAKLAELGPQVAEAFSNVMRRGLGSMVWVDEMTEMQYTALQAAISGEFMRLGESVEPAAAAAMEHLGASSTQALATGMASSSGAVTGAARGAGEAMVGQVTEALAELPAVAEEEGAASGGMFARAFNAAQGALAEMGRNYVQEFAEDPQWQADMEKARVLAADVKQYFSAAAADFRAEFAEDPQWQAAMAEARELSAAVVAGIKDAYGAISDLGGAAVERVKAGIGAIGDFGAAMVAREKEALSAFGDLGVASVARVRGAFESLSAYAQENADTLSGKFAGALTSSVTAFTGSVSALGESVRLLFAKAPEQAGLAGAETGAAFDRMLAEGIAQSSPDAVAALQELQAQVSAALTAGDDELAQSLITRVDAIQFAANQALDLSEPAQRAVAGLETVDGQLDAVFESIYQHGSLMSSNLAGAMTNALAGIEADTSGFTTRELAQWNEFFTTLDERGTAAAYQLAVSMGSLQGKDLLSLGVGSTGQSMGAGFGQSAGEIEQAGAAAKTAESEAASAASSFGLFGGAMGGVGMQAMFLGSMALPYLGQAASALIGALEPTKAALLDVQQLESAIGSDGGTAGAATAAFVAQSSATDGLAASAKQAGVSLATWTEAVMGNASAQGTVTAAVEKLNQAQVSQQALTDENAKQTGKFSGELNDAQTTVASASAATNRLTDANQKLLNSMQAEHAQIVSTIQSQTQMAQATETLDMNSQILGATMTGLYTKMQLSAQQAAISSVANLNLGTTQMGLNTQLVNAEQAYTEAQNGASAYQTVLTALNGTALSAAQAQNTLAGDMVTAKATFEANKDSLNLNAQAGVTDREALVSASQAIIAMGVAQFQATGNMNKANQTITQQIENYVNATGATGKAKNAIEQYLEQITKIPPNVSTNVNLNTGPAYSGLATLLQRINSSSGTVNVYENSSGQVFSSGGGNRAQAVGGPSTHYAAVGGSQGGGATVINEQGPELVDLPNGSMVMPAANTASLFGGGFGGWEASSVIQLEVNSVGGANGLEQMFINWLKSAIRARAGGGPNSVQQALGQTR